MLFKGKPQEYPSLTAYLRHQEACGNDEPRRLARAALTVVLMSAFVALTVLVLVERVPAALAFLVALGAIAYKVSEDRRRKSIEAGPDERLKAQAATTGKTMLKCLEKRRLHRDLDAGSLILLEESAACWIRVHNVLTSPCWVAKDLPDGFVSIRTQTLAAAELGMNEMLILFRPYLPNEVKNRAVGDYVEEAIEGFVFNGVKVPDLPSPAFSPARQIAERLRDLARQVDAVGLDDILGGPLMKPRATAALDQCLYELRGLNEAGRELRQGIDS